MGWLPNYHKSPPPPYQLGEIPLENRANEPTYDQFVPRHLNGWESMSYESQQDLRMTAARMREVEQEYVIRRGLATEVDVRVTDWRGTPPSPVYGVYESSRTRYVSASGNLQSNRGVSSSPIMSTYSSSRPGHVLSFIQYNARRDGQIVPPHYDPAQLEPGLDMSDLSRSDNSLWSGCAGQATRPRSTESAYPAGTNIPVQPVMYQSSAQAASFDTSAPPRPASNPAASVWSYSVMPVVLRGVTHQMSQLGHQGESSSGHASGIDAPNPVVDARITLAKK